jgi:hypothetical protein
MTTLSGTLATRNKSAGQAQQKANRPTSRASSSEHGTRTGISTSASFSYILERPTFEKKLGVGGSFWAFTTLCINGKTMHTLTFFTQPSAFCFLHFRILFGDDTHNNSEILAGLSFFFHSFSELHFPLKSIFCFFCLDQKTRPPSGTITPYQAMLEIRHSFRTGRRLFIKATTFCYHYFLEPNAT